MSHDRRILIAACIIVALLGLCTLVLKMLAEPDTITTAVKNAKQMQSQKPTPTPNPLTIPAIQARQYPGGSVSVDQDLGVTDKFHSYIVSYLSDGLKINALMNVPTSAKPANGYPVVIINHGYISPDKYSTVNSYSTFTAFYANHGFLVLKPDYRGNAQSEGQPIDARLSPGYVDDVLNLINSVKTIPQADPTSIALWGHSMGGGITLQALTATNAVKAAVIWAGVVGTPQDMVQMAQDPNYKAPDWLKQAAEGFVSQYGVPNNTNPFWHDIAAINYVADISAPIQIHHGTADEDVPLQFSQHLDTVLTQANKPHQLFTYPGADHNFYTDDSRQQFLSRTLTFFQQSLQH